VLNATVTSNSIAARLQNLETLNITGRYTTTGFDLANTSGVKVLNVNSSVAGGTATVTNASTLNAQSIEAGDKITTVSVTATASGTRDAVAVKGGSATSVTAAGGAGADTFSVTLADGASGTFNGGGSVDAYTINVGPTATLTGNTATETVRINATAASTVTLGGVLTDTVATVSTAKTTVGGGGAITIKGTKALLDGTAIVQDGSSATVEITDAAAGLSTSKMVVDTIRLKVNPTAGTVTINDADPR